jgi:hypothetical protein
MFILSKEIYRFNTIPNKITMLFFAEIKKSIIKFIWKHINLQIHKAILSKKSNAGIEIPDFKLFNRVVVTKTAS